MNPRALILRLALPTLVATTAALASPPVAAAPLPSASLYHLDGSFTDQSGATVTLDVFRGQPVLIGMVYASCPSACPLLISNLKAVLAALPEDTRAEVKVVLVSLDPKRDTPERLAQLAKLHQLDQTRWRFLRSDEGTMREVAAVLGVRFRDDGNGAISHTSNVALLDRDGVIVVQTEKIAPPPQDLLGKITALAKPGA